MSVKLCVEGGGDRKTLRRNLRRGLGKFIEKAGLQGKMPRMVACGSRNDAYHSFRTAQDRGEPAMLLVDAEGPVSTSEPWQHLKARDGWNRPDGATDDQCHLMVQVMESWFLADADALESFYGRDFERRALPARPNIEQVSKRDVRNGLASATRNTTKGSYDKGAPQFRHSG